MTLAPAPTLILGALSIDDRGGVAFVNGFDPSGQPFATPRLPAVRRLYLTSNHRPGQVRAWHGHREEGKYVMAVGGVAKVAAVQVEDWDVGPGRVKSFSSGEAYAADRETGRSRSAAPLQFILSAHQPSCLYLPPGWANGWQSLTPDCRLLWFSTATLAESAADDYRWPARTWDCWKVEER